MLIRVVGIAVCAAFLLAITPTDRPVHGAEEDLTLAELELKLADDWPANYAEQSGGAKRSVGPDAFGYSAVDAETGTFTFDFFDISGTGTPVVTGDDVLSAPIVLGAPFSFYGIDYADVIMSSNGWLGWDTATSGSDFGNDCPLPAVPNVGGVPRIAVLHDDFILGTDGGLYEFFPSCPVTGHELDGIDQPCSVFMWDNADHFNADGVDQFDFEVVLYHTTGEIFVQIGPGNPERGSGSTTGLQNEDATIGITYACNSMDSIPDNTAIAFFPPGVLFDGDIEFSSDPFLEAVRNFPCAHTIVTSNFGGGSAAAITANILPDWLTLTDNGDGTAELSGTPLRDDLGLNPVELVATGANLVPVIQGFDIMVHPVPTLVNPSFETGDLSGWDAEEIRGVSILLDAYAAGFNPEPLLIVTEPTDGAFVAAHGFNHFSLTFPSQTLKLAQDIFVPADGSIISVFFDHRGGWDLLTLGTATLPRTFDVTIEPAGGGAPLETMNIETANINEIVADTGALTTEIDLAAYAGQIIRISFDWTVPETNTGPGLFQLDNVRYGNTPPFITSEPPSGAFFQGFPFSHTVTATDSDAADVLAYDMSTFPSWVSLTDNGDGSAVFSGTPGPGDETDTTFTVVVSDAVLATDTQVFSVELLNLNDPPAFTSVAVTIAVQDVGYAYDIATADPDPGDTRVIAASALPGWLGLTDNGDGTAGLAGTPDAGDVGDLFITLIVTDAGGLSDTQSFTIAVANVNDAPLIITSPVLDGSEDAPYQYDLAASDLDGTSSLTFSAVTLPSWLTLEDFGDGLARLSGTPGNDDVGSNDVAIEVADGDGGTNSQTFMIAVANVNGAPRFTSAPVTGGMQDAAYSYAIQTADSDDGDTVAITAPGLVSWLSLTDNGDGTALLEGTPGNDNVGVNTVVLDGTDGADAVGLQVFTIEVVNVNDPPMFTSEPVTAAMEGVAYVYVAISSDIDRRESLSISATTLPSWLTLDDNGDGTAVLSGTAPNSKQIDYAVSLVVSDDENASDTQDFTIVASQIGGGEGGGEGTGEGAGEGVGEGASEGGGEGSGEGSGEGGGEGASEGGGEGANEGAGEGASEGGGEGSGEGASEGSGEGAGEGVSEGAGEGASEGATEGTGEGVSEGASEGVSEGSNEGSGEGSTEGASEGTSEGAGEGGGCSASASQSGAPPVGDGLITLFLAMCLLVSRKWYAGRAHGV